MSVVAVKKIDNGFEIAADNICMGYNLIQTEENNKTLKFSKLVKINNMYIGGVGKARDVSMLCLYGKTHIVRDNSNDGMFEWFSEFLTWKKEKTEIYGAEDSYFIICIEDKAYYFCNFFITEISEYFAIGAGEEYAMAALRLGHSAEEAVKVACDLSPYCCEPVHKFESTISN